MYYKLEIYGEPVAPALCRHLRSKAMYVAGSMDGEDHPDEEGSHYCWCNLTQHVLGPDQKDVSRSRCGPGRSCYQPK